MTGPSGFSSEFNVTTNTVVITGLQCSTSYNIDVTAVNCAGVSTVNTTSFTIKQPGELYVIILYILIVLAIGLNEERKHSRHIVIFRQVK